MGEWERKRKEVEREKTETEQGAGSERKGYERRIEFAQSNVHTVCNRNNKNKADTNEFEVNKRPKETAGLFLF